MESAHDLQERRERAADKIQKLWRSYTNRKIYKYYKDIIMFKCKYARIYQGAIQLNYSRASIHSRHSYWRLQ